MKIIVPKEISNKLIEVIVQHNPYEIKGSFYAEQIKENFFIIDDVYVSEISGNRFFSNLIVNARYKKFERDYYSKKNFIYTKYNYIGDWHSHPSYECIPSDYDRKEIRKEFRNSNANFLVQFIFKVIDEKLIGNAFLCKGNEIVKIEELVIEQ